MLTNCQSDVQECLGNILESTSFLDTIELMVCWPVVLNVLPLLTACSSVTEAWKMHMHCNQLNHLRSVRGWVGLWGFLWWAPSAKRKDHHRVSSRWSSTWFHANTGLSSTQHEQIPIIFWGLAILADSLLFSVNNILEGLWLNCISSVEITLFLLADMLLQHRALFQC